MKKIVYLLICAAVLFLILVQTGTVVLDHSAARGFENSVTWKGHTYIPCVGEYREGKTIAKTTDGWSINEVEEDPTHTFIVLRSYLDQYLLVRQDYEIPTSGDVTAVVWGGERITDEAFCTVTEEILAMAKTDFSYQTEAVFQQTDTRHMLELSIAYGDCPVAAHCAGYMGTVDGKWVITTEISDDQRNPDGTPKLYTVYCFTISEEYHQKLTEYIR